jgi:hypothetical protein
MNRRFRVPVFLLMAIALTAPSYAARGIITKKPSGGTISGRLIITDLDPANPSIEPGDSLPFDESPGSFVTKFGDYVSFDIATNGSGTPAAVNLHLISAGQVISGIYNQDIVVESDKAVIVMKSGFINGKITCNGGALLILGSIVLGNIDVDNGSAIVKEGARVRQISFDPLRSTPADCILSVQDSTINGNLRLMKGRHMRAYGKISASNVHGKVVTDGIDIVKLHGNMHLDDVSLKGGLLAAFSSCTIRGKLEVLDAERCKVVETTVSGTINILP